MLNNKRVLGASAFGTLFAFSVLLTGCGGGASSPNSPAGNNSVVSNGANVVPITVDAGPTSTIQADMAYVTVTICMPGTSTCQTINHIQVDTGSEGLRLISSLVTVGLPQQNDSGETRSPNARNSRTVTPGARFRWQTSRLAVSRRATCRFK